jgi:ParB-like chromosome segregation protein Spo0J
MLELRPIVIDENNIVLGGNMRLKACQELGLKDVPTIFAKDLTEDQKKEFIIKDNVGFGEWNWDDLANDWDETKLVEWGLDLPVFNPNINDIEEVEEFNEAVIFQIKCDSIEELEKLQTKLNTSSKKIGYNEFIIKAGL